MGEKNERTRETSKVCAVSTVARSGKGEEEGEVAAHASIPFVSCLHNNITSSTFTFTFTQFTMHRVLFPLCPH